MMKKLCLILLLSCLLILCACSKEEPEAPTDSSAPVLPEIGADSGSEAEEPIPQNEVVDYQAILGEWSKYLGYLAPEEPFLSRETLFDLSAGDTYTDLGGNFVTVKTSRTEEGQSISRYALYHLKNGIQIGTDWESAQGDKDPRYSFRVSGAVVEVESSLWSEEISPAGYVTSYRYYDASGAVINEQPLAQSELEEYERNGYTFTTVCGKCYVSREGELLSVFAAGEERVIPEADLIYDGYRYLFGAEEIRILDGQGKELMHYPLSSAYDETDTVVLGNGNVLVYRRSVCDRSATDYTAEDRFGEKTALSYVLLDVVKREVREIAPTFALVTESVITSVENRNTCLVPLGEYQYAEVYKITGGRLASGATPVILDHEMNVVTELPLILKHQQSVVCAVSEHQLVIRADGVGAGNERYYSANLVTCKVTLYPDLASGLYETVDRGFVFENVLYHRTMTDTVPLRAGTYEILGGRVFVRDGNGLSIIFPSGGQFLRKTLESGELILHEDAGLYEVIASDGATRFLYNRQGDTVATAQTWEVVRHFGDSLVLRCDGADGSVYYTLR